MIISPLFFFFLFCFVSGDTIGFTGTITETSPAFNIPEWNSGICAPSNQSFPLSFTSAGVWEVIASAEPSISRDFKIYIYTSFYPENSCLNSINRALTKQLITKSNSGPIIRDFINFHHPSYVVVVSVPSGSFGSFGINFDFVYIIPSLHSGTTVGAPLWPIAVTNNSRCQSFTSSSSTPFGYYTWTQSESGYFDILALFDSSVISWYSFLVLYNTIGLTFRQLQNPCNNERAGRYLVSTSNIVPARGTGLWFQFLRENSTYTIAFSGYGSKQIGYYGIRIDPTSVRFPKHTSFVQPQRAISHCLPDPYKDDSSWDSFIFTSQNRLYFIDTLDVVAPLVKFDTYSFMYRGENSLSPPVGCPHFAKLVSQSDTGDIYYTALVLHTEIGTNYTVVVSTFTGSQTGNNVIYAYIINVISGTHLPDFADESELSFSHQLTVSSSLFFMILFLL